MSPNSPQAIPPWVTSPEYLSMQITSGYDRAVHAGSHVKRICCPSRPLSRIPLAWCGDISMPVMSSCAIFQLVLLSDLSRCSCFNLM